MTDTLITGALAAALGMRSSGAVQLRTGNAGIVDAGWALEVAGLSIFFTAVGPGWMWRRVALAVAVGVWGARLGMYILRDRVLSPRGQRGRKEDGRYAKLRRQWGASARGRFLCFFLAQAGAAVFFAVPALFVSQNPQPALSLIEGAALALWATAWLGEAVADRQLERFKAQPGNKGRTCQAGLWRYSRHPNYFFEWLVWVSIALFATASPWGWVAWACPIVMLYLLFRVTGIPETEAQALRTRGDDYRRYQHTTSPFVPWFPRRA